MAENGIPELTLEQIAELCEGAEKTARKYIISKVSTNKIVTFDITVEAEGIKPITINMDVSVVLSPIMKDFDVKSLTKEATKRALAHVEDYLRELECTLKKY